MKLILKCALLGITLAQLSCSTMDEAPKPAPRKAAPSSGSATNTSNRGTQKQQTQKTKLASTAAATSAPSIVDQEWAQLRNQVKKQSWNNVLLVADWLAKQPGLTPAQNVELATDHILAMAGNGQFPEALQATDTLLQDPNAASEANGLTAMAGDWIDGKLTENSLQNVTHSLKTPLLAAKAQFRLGQMQMDDHQLDSARDSFGRAINAAPGTDPALRAQDLLNQLDASRKVEPKTIGVVLPLTGKFANLAQKTLHGIEMGLGLTGESGSTSSFRLAVVDSEGNADAARKGVDRLIQEDNVIAIIGSMLSKTATAEAARASEMGVPSITLSQKNGVTELSPYVFRNALTSEMQVHQLVKSAMEDMGLKRFAILYPNDQYGVEYANLFWDEVRARGGTVTSVQTYSDKETDFRYVVQRLVGTYYLEDRAEEYKVRLKEWSEAAGHHGANRNTPPDDLLPPIVDFDAIFIPDNAKSLGQISAMLAYNNVRGTKLLGTNLWNVPGLAKRAGNFSKDLLFVDGFVNTDQRYQNSTFVKEHRALFGEDPGPFEVQGYDTALLLRQLIMSGHSSREGLMSGLGQMQDFSGALGRISMSPAREIQRPVVSLTLEGADIVALKTNDSQRQ